MILKMYTYKYINVCVIINAYSLNKWTSFRDERKHLVKCIEPVLEPVTHLPERSLLYRIFSKHFYYFFKIIFYFYIPMYRFFRDTDQYYKQEYHVYCCYIFRWNDQEGKNYFLNTIQEGKPWIKIFLKITY